jgi:hypothetical protein
MTTIGRLARLMRGEPEDLRGVIHLTVPPGWHEGLPEVVGHYILAEDGTIGAAAAECPDCRARLAGLDGEPAQPTDDLPF